MHGESPRRRQILPAAGWLLIACLGMSTVTPAAQTQSPAAKPFDAATAAQLLSQVRDGLVGRNPKKMLNAFDLGKMPDGSLFRQQVASFFAQTTTIRMHFNLVQASMEEGKGMAVVDVEMEADQRDEDLPPVHKQARLRLTAESTGDGWKLTDVQPRRFFSTAP